MMKLTQSEFDRLAPEDKMDYLAMHGRSFVSTPLEDKPQRLITRKEFDQLSFFKKEVYRQVFVDDFLPEPITVGPNPANPNDMPYGIAPLPPSPEAIAATAESKARATSLAKLRATTAYEGPRLLAGFITVLGIIGSAAMIVVALANDELGTSSQIFLGVIGVYGLAMIGIGYGISQAIFDIADRAHQKSKD